MEKCPTNPVKISSLRKIINTDEKKFPWRKYSNGYFLIKLEGKKIHCGFVNNNHEMTFEFVGTNPDNMIKEIAEKKLCNLEHMGYIASELMIAFNCISDGKKYIQR